jgi:hypothetical protein
MSIEESIRGGDGFEGVERADEMVRDSNYKIC